MEKNLRKRKNEDYKKVYSKGFRFYNKDFNGLYLDSKNNGPRVGFTITKKYGKANMRNRTRRRLKEIVRLNRDILPNLDIIIVPKKHTYTMDFNSLNDSYLNLIYFMNKRYKRK